MFTVIASMILFMVLIQSGMFRVMGVLFSTMLLISLCLAVYIVFLGVLFKGVYF